MKKRALSLLLVLSLLAGCLGVYTALVPPVSAETAEVSEQDPDINVIFDRDYDDLDSVAYGASTYAPKGNSYEKMQEDGDAFLRITATSTATESDGFIQLSLDDGSNGSKTLVLKMKIRVTPENAGFGRIAYIRHMQNDNASSNYTSPHLAYLTAGGVRNFASNGKVIYPCDGEFHELVYVVTYVDKGSSTDVVISVYLDPSDEEGANSPVDAKTISSTATDPGVTFVRIGTQTVTDSIRGKYFDLSQITAYTCSADVADPINCGYESSSSVPSDLKASMFMKIGVGHSLTLGERIECEAPARVDGKAYIPLTALADYFGLTLTATDGGYSFSGGSSVALTVGSAQATVNGASVMLDGEVAVYDGYGVVLASDVAKLFKGYSASVSNMGLITVNDGSYTLSDDDLEGQMTVMKRFVFDVIDPALKQVSVITPSSLADLGAHPYILADQNKFDELHAIYLDDGADPVLKGYLDYLVEAADAVLPYYATYSNGEYAGIQSSKIVNPYTTTNGYDPYGGRLNQAPSHAARIRTLAMAYQITREQIYARLAYDYAIVLGDWDHWGPGHYLNCADTAQPYALAYDWLYNAWLDLGLDVTEVATRLFRNGLLPAFYSVTDVTCPWARKEGDASHYIDRTNNWNAVCSAGTIAAGLALGTDLSTLDGLKIRKSVYSNGTFSYSTVDALSIGDHYGFSTYQDYAAYLINNNLYYLIMNGLGQYAPDGSYVESASYWSYGTNNLFNTAAYLDSTIGTDFGLMESWGLDTTCLFALNSQSADYILWNYHDSGNEKEQNTSAFGYVAQALSQPDLALIRKDIVADGGGDPTYMDVFYYIADASDYEMPALSYHMVGIDGFVVRDGWERGSIYAAIMGGANNAGHAQVDSGSFVYHNAGTAWFLDIGTEEYNTDGFWGTNRDRYYRMNAEGNNTLCYVGSDDMIGGQYKKGFGDMYSTGSNEYGAFTLIDQTSVYYDTVTSAKRGMLLTNDRRTVVIQDEVRFARESTVYWFAHTAQNVVVSSDGRSAVLFDGKNYLRAAILSEDETLRFTVMDAYTFVLDTTIRPGYSLGTVGVDEKDRSQYKKLAIKCEDVTSLDLAVVIEEVSSELCEEIGYELVPMDSWIPTADGRQTDVTVAYDNFDGKGVGTLRPSAELSADELRIMGNGAMYLHAAEKDGVLVLDSGRALRGASLGEDVLVLEADYTAAGATGATLALTKGNGTAVVSCGLNSSASVGEWVRVTVIVYRNTAYIFEGNTRVGTVPIFIDSYEGLDAAVTVPAGSSLYVDNVRLSRRSEGRLAQSVIDGDKQLLTTSLSSMERRVIGFVGVISDMEYKLLGSSFGDTPWVDEDARFFYTLDELYAAVKEGDVVTLISDNSHLPMNVTVPCKIYHRGFALSAGSDSLMAYELYSGCTEFKEGSVTVSWIADGETVLTETYGSSSLATFKGNDARLGNIVESLGADGVFSYGIGCWCYADGTPVTDFTVTDTNCEFYLMSAPLDATFVCEISDRVFKDFHSESELGAALMGGYKKVVLTSDVYLDYSMTVRANFEFYLNGHTLTYNAPTSSAHMIHISGTRIGNVYGNGTMVMENDQGNLFYTSGGNSTLVVDGVTFEVVRTVIDLRRGTATFRNCTVNMKDLASAFSVNNRDSSKDNYVTDPDLMPLLILDNTVVNGGASASEAIQVTRNARVLIRGGSIINYPQGKLFRFTNGGNVTTDYIESVRYMEGRVGDAYVNVKELIEQSNVDGGADMSGKLVLDEGARLPLVPDVGSYSVGVSLARTGEDNYAYRVCSSDAVTEVSWVIGDTTVSETWVQGAFPVADNPEVKAALAALNATVQSGYKYSVPLKELTESAVTLEARRFTAFPIKMNMTLHADFTVNLYVPVQIKDTEINGFYVNGKLVEAETAFVDGADHYKVSLDGINPAKAADNILFAVDLTDSLGQSRVCLSLSILKYADTILSSATHSYESKALMGTVIRYSTLAYEYAGNTLTDGYGKLLSLTAKHADLGRFAQYERDEGDMTAVLDGLSYAMLNLKSAPNFVFGIAEGYNGKLTFSYESVGSVRTETFTVTDGKVDGRSYVELRMRASDMTEPITVCTEGGTAVYSLANYLCAMSDGTDTLSRLLNTLYAYAECAEIYRNYVEIGGVMD